MNTVALKIPKRRSENSAISKLSKKIFDSNEGIFRGFRFGQDLDEIISQERFKVFEKEKEYTGVSFTNTKMETIDILYFKNVFNKLDKIQVDVFMNTEKSANDLFDAFYFQIFEKHGFPIPIKDGYCWNHEFETKISLTKVENQIEQGLLLVFEK
ncbi:hypothetical protein EGI22_08980 [Lacihabitans sp. LS3-19]|uniref:hypothetical protein n=1 Tax=Lacihabitans sp. LS3-19 TaxID=2487335 RepID=UPI0020CC5BE4|nr:hypothetical protein [Lacihabitans sp. LS3-19]MCP9768046.1 hypothetical protein [Lacihabitans sp. LS3-19]